MTLQEMILLAVLREGPDATAGDVQAALSKALGREQAFGSVFVTLDRLSDGKMIRWRKGEPDDRRSRRSVDRRWRLRSTPRARWRKGLYSAVRHSRMGPRHE
jgi:DNA-binding MarR family transcriptional regulator